VPESPESVQVALCLLKLLIKYHAPDGLHSGTTERVIPERILGHWFNYIVGLEFPHEVEFKAMLARDDEKHALK